MKIKALFVALSLLACFPGAGSAKDELVMFKEALYWSNAPSFDNSACFQLIFIEAGRDVPDMRKEKCAFIDGKFSITLSGPPGTAVTFFGEYGFKKGNGFLTIKKKDDKKLWLLGLADFPDGQWLSLEATDDSGAFDAFYSASPLFERSISSIKWGSGGP